MQLSKYTHNLNKRSQFSISLMIVNILLILSLMIVNILLRKLVLTVCRDQLGRLMFAIYEISTG